MRIDSQRVAPSASAPSFKAGGTVFSTSMVTEAMVGRIMRARMTPAARKPSPMGGPLKMGRKPSVLWRKGWTSVRSQGTRTKSPQRP